MIAHNVANQTLRALSVPTAKSKKNTSQQRRIRAAAPRYMTEAQAAALKAAGEHGWVARSIVANAKTKRCAVSIQNGDEVAWIDHEGHLKSEDDILREAGAV
jgi:type III secretion system FlhB-like substrate exporter